MDGIIIGIIVVAAIALFAAIVNGKLSKHHGGIATITAFHDFQPKNRQDAIEIVIEKKASKEWFRQSNGKPEGTEEKEKN